MKHLFRELMRCIERLDMQDWVFVLAGMIIVGFLCLRGFGSRSNY